VCVCKNVKGFFSEDEEEILCRWMQKGEGRKDGWMERRRRRKEGERWNGGRWDGFYRFDPELLWMEGEAIPSWATTSPI
jgi:hypothetical protein